MPDFISNMTGQECAALVDGNTCNLVTMGLAEKLGANVQSDGTCGILEGGECPAFRSRQAIWVAVKDIADNFAPPIRQERGQ